MVEIRARHKRRDQSEHGTGKQQPEFFRCELQLGSVTPEDVGSRGEGLLLVQHEIGQADSHLVQQFAVVNLAKVDHTQQSGISFGLRVTHNQIVIVKVPMDNAIPLPFELGRAVFPEVVQVPVEQRQTLRANRRPVFLRNAKSGDTAPETDAGRRLAKRPCTVRTTYIW